MLYLRGVSTGDFQEALTALLGKDAPILSPSVVSGLKAEWQGEYARWQTWQRSRAENQLPDLVAGVSFRNGTEILDRTSDRAA